MSAGSLTHTIGFVASYRSLMGEVRARHEVLTQFGTTLTQEEFETLTHGPEVRALRLCSDSSNITSAEFCLYMLVKMGRVSTEELHACQDTFDVLDTTHTGKIDYIDLVKHEQKRNAQYAKGSDSQDRSQRHSGVSSISSKDALQQPVSDGTVSDSLGQKLFRTITAADVLSGDSGRHAAHVHDSSVQCTKCGNMFMGDAKFCRKCGKPRPVSFKEETGLQRQVSQEKCSCGNVFVADAVFCRKCGRGRQIVEPSAESAYGNFDFAEVDTHGGAGPGERNANRPGGPADDNSGSEGSQSGLDV